MATFSKEIVQHFTHCFHPLTEVPPGSEFFCKGCRTLGSGTRYRCEVCDLDLHQYCVDFPMELSSFMHQHSLKLVGCKPGHVCDLCDDPIKGLFYRCEPCDFNVHPICTQLPEYTQHVMHKDHPLRLEISVPNGCMVCKDMCWSWRYRCEVCCFHLHLDCTLAPCEEETTMSKTKTRSLGTPAPPQPSAWPPAFGGYNCSYGYGGIPPPPQYFAQPSFPPHVHGYAYGGIPPSPPQYFAQPSFAPHVHSYGSIHPPPHYLAQPSFPSHVHSYGSIHPPQYLAQPSFPPHVHSYGGMHPPPQYLAQPSFPPHVHGYGGIPPPHHHHQYLAQPSFPTDADHGHGTPSTDQAESADGHGVPSTDHAQSADGHGAPSTDHAQSSGSQVQGHVGKVRKRMDAIVRNLTFGVVCNVIATVLLAAVGV